VNELKELIGFVSDLDFNDLPVEVKDRAKLHLMDFMANAVAGGRLEEGRRIATHIRGLGDREEATVLSFGFKTSCGQAALANGTLGALLQSHDGFKHGGSHPSSSVIPTALALAENRRLGGREFILAVVTGYELANRISAAIHPSHSLKGFAPTGTTGTFAAAGAAGKLLNLSREKLGHALGIAGFLLPVTTYETLLGKRSITPVHGGYAGKVGIECALLAGAGYQGAPDILRGEFGKGFCLITSDSYQAEKLTQGLGRDFAIMETYFKPFPACRHTHGALELVLGWVKQEKIGREEVEKVRVRTFEMAMQFVQYTEPGAELYECQMSIPYVLAVALWDGELSFRQFSRQRREDPALHEFSRKVEVREDQELTRAYPAKTPAMVELVLKDGRRLEGRIDLPAGDPGNPISKEQLTAKARENCRDLGPERTETFLAGVEDLENSPDMGGLVSCLGKAPEHR
jgi:2-methylcitrate dehydratase PrpD